MRADALGLPVTLDLDGKRVLLIGDDDDERARKLLLLRDARAMIDAIEPAQFFDDMLDGCALAMLTAHDRQLAQRLFAAARSRHVLVWCSDDPKHSDLAMPAIARLGRVRIATSTAGAAPALAKLVRVQLEAALDNAELARFVDALAELRDRLQRDEPDFDKRREALTRALDDFQLRIGVDYPAWLKSDDRG